MNHSEIFNILEKFENKVTLHPNFLFRGQSDAKWSLEPSFTRIAKGRNLERIKALQLERESVNKFSISARNLLPIEETVTLIGSHGQLDFLGWFSVMQHFSAPTRNLDWSCSYWIALYFACSEKIDNDAAIWVADFNKVTEHFNKKTKPDVSFSKLCTDVASEDLISFTMSYVTNQRIEAQQGRFSICTNPLSNHEILLRSIGALEKITIPASLKPQIMSILLNMNINAKTLYPGIDGLGKSITEYCNLWSESRRIS